MVAVSMDTQEKAISTAMQVANDTLKIDGERIHKLLRETSYRELYNELMNHPRIVTRNKDGEVIVSYENFRLLCIARLPHMRKATERHKIMCGCEPCLTMKYAVVAISHFRRTLCQQLANQAELPFLPTEEKARRKAIEEYNKFCYPSGDPSVPRHEGSSDVLAECMCAPVVVGDAKHYPWKCVIGECKKCPALKNHPFEDDDSNHLLISYEHYVNRTRCTIHGDLRENQTECTLCLNQPEGKKKGKVRSKKYRTLSRTTIASFFKNHYLPLIKKYKYHNFLVKLLSRRGVGDGRHAAMMDGTASVLTKRDFAEAISAAMFGEVQSERYGDQATLKLEGCTAEYAVPPDEPDEEDSGINETDENEAERNKSVKQYFANFSDDCKQNAATSYENFHYQIEALVSDGIVPPKGAIIFDNTDGCTNQYRKAGAVYLLSMLAVQFGCIIDRLIHAPTHGKDEVDAMNSVEKKHLLECMHRVAGSTDSDRTSRFAPWLYQNGRRNSPAEEAVRLCSSETRKDGVEMIGDKFAARRNNRAFIKRTYRSLPREEVKFEELDMNTIKFTNGKCKTHSGIMSRYNIRCDANLGVGRAAIRRIPCSCDSCLQALQAPWIPGTEAEQQPRYKENRSCDLWPVFLGENNWEIVTITPSSGVSEKLQETAKEVVLEDLTKLSMRGIEKGTMGAVNIDDKKEEFSPALFVSEPYLDPDCDGVNTLDYVVDAKFLYKIDATTNWYYIPPFARSKKVCVQHVLCESIKMTKRVPGKRPDLPRSVPKQDRNSSVYKHAYRLEADSLNEINDELLRRSKLEYTILSTDEDEAESDESSDSDSSQSN